MAPYEPRIMAGFFNSCDNGGTGQVRGKAFEDLSCYLFESIPGILFTERNVMNVFQNEEIDLTLWNEKYQDGLPFLPYIIPVECKNWTNPVSSIEVAWFAAKLQNRGLDFGILIANAGVTGNEREMNAAHNTIATNLAQGRKILVITREEINRLANTDDMTTLIKKKMLLLHAGGRM